MVSGEEGGCKEKNRRYSLWKKFSIFRSLYVVVQSHDLYRHWLSPNQSFSQSNSKDWIQFIQFAFCHSSKKVLSKVPFPSHFPGRNSVITVSCPRLSSRTQMIFFLFEEKDVLCDFNHNWFVPSASLFKFSPFHEGLFNDYPISRSSISHVLSSSYKSNYSLFFLILSVVLSFRWRYWFC